LQKRFYGGISLAYGDTAHGAGMLQRSTERATPWNNPAVSGVFVQCSTPGTSPTDHGEWILARGILAPGI